MLEILLIAAMWGTSFAFIKVAAQAGMSPFSIAAARGGLTATAFALWFLVTNRGISHDRLTLRHMLMLGVLNGLIPNVLIAIAMQQIESAPAAIIQATVPAIVAVLAHFLLPQDRLGWQQWAGIMIGFAGVIVVINPAAIINGKASLLGSMAMLGAALSYATSTIYLRLAKPADTYSTALGQQLVSAIGAAALGALWEPEQGWQYPASVWLALAGLAILATAIPTILYFKLVSRVESGKAALVQYFLPIAAGLYAALILDEAFRLGLLVGGLIVLVGVWLATRPSETRFTEDP